MCVFKYFCPFILFSFLFLSFQLASPKKVEEKCEDEKLGTLNFLSRWGKNITESMGSKMVFTSHSSEKIFYSTGLYTSWEKLNVFKICTDETETDRHQYYEIEMKTLNLVEMVNDMPGFTMVCNQGFTDYDEQANGLQLVETLLITFFKGQSFHQESIMLMTRDKDIDEHSDMIQQYNTMKFTPMLVVDGIMLKNIYVSTNMYEKSNNPDFPEKIYFSLDSGLVAFEHHNVLWVRKKQP